MSDEAVDELRTYHAQLKRRNVLCISATIIVLFIVLIVTLSVGNYPISIKEFFNLLIGKPSDATISYVFYKVRVPRILCCCFAGAALSCAGLVMQSLFKNPMASPSVLGISSGAAFGASLALAFGIGGFLGRFAVSGMAFLFCCLTMCAVYFLARTKYGVSSVTLLLAGVAIGAFFNGLVSLLQYIVDENTLSSIVYWTMGSFNSCGWNSFYTAVVPVTIGIIMMFLCRRELNLISAGEEQAANLGVNVKLIRIVLIVATALAVGGSVAISGVIGFVGLIVPHIFRMLAGSDHRLLMPLCIFGGAAFMLLMDTISKAAFSISLPVGVLTSLLGAPFFIYVMRRRSREVWE